MNASADTQSEQIQKLLEIARLTPTRSNLVLFVGRSSGRLIDNGKYAFLEANRHDYGFDPLFVTTFADEHKMLKTAGLPSALFSHVASYKKIAQASVLVSDDFGWKSTLLALLVQRAKTLQLWHGIPLKAIGFEEIASPVNMNPEKADELAYGYSGYDAVLSTSSYVSQHIFNRVFKCKTFTELGYPRNDGMLRTPDKKDMLNVDTKLFNLARQHQRNNGKVVAYLPTFRDSGRNIFSDGAIDPFRLSSFALEHNILFIFKFHPYVSLPVDTNIPNLYFCQSHYDMYPVLPHIDLLVTDYSSIYFDFLLLDKPIHFHVYDLEKYTTNDREFMLDFDQWSPGTRSTDPETFFAALYKILIEGQDPYAPARKACCERLFAHHDAHASQRVCEYIRDVLCGL